MAKRCVAETGAKGGILIQSDLEKAIVESADKETARLSRQHQQGKENLERVIKLLINSTLQMR